MLNYQLDEVQILACMSIPDRLYANRQRIENYEKDLMRGTSSRIQMQQVQSVKMKTIANFCHRFLSLLFLQMIKLYV